MVLSIRLCVLVSVHLCFNHVDAISQIKGTLVRNLARGSALKMVCDLSGGLPLEVWKSSVVLEAIRAAKTMERPASDLACLRKVVQARGFKGLWTGLEARMLEGALSGAVLLGAKESIRVCLVPLRLSPAFAGFVSGAGGGACQAIVMGPCSLIVTAATASGGKPVTSILREVWAKDGLAGLYQGSGAVAARQATNWASRQGFTEFIRPYIKIKGVGGEILAGCLGGTFSAWNTPFEVARIESQTSSFDKNSKSKKTSLVSTLKGICDDRGPAALFTGLVPRIFQACYQTIFMVCIPRVLDAR
mmetsp:Transcript_1303/g.2766  ORF Transcript_1303/g.2766 Transcript_1303/m.2766 type:complete len:303 (+) Transcript_1303:113-1021(+)